MLRQKRKDLLPLSRRVRCSPSHHYAILTIIGEEELTSHQATRPDANPK